MYNDQEFESGMNTGCDDFDYEIIEKFYRQGQNDENEGLQRLIEEVVFEKERQLLDLPTDFDLWQPQKLTENLSDLADALSSSSTLDKILMFLGMKDIVSRESNFYKAQVYIRDYVYAEDWPKDCFFADVIDIGKKHGVETYGCLAELIAGFCYNVPKVFSIVVWNSLHAQDLDHQLPYDLQQKDIYCNYNSDSPEYKETDTNIDTNTSTSIST
eukprot:Pgem_evm3s6721